MFTIRPEQFQVLNESWFQRWQEDLAASLRRKYPNRMPSSDLELSNSVNGWIQDAVKWGFSDPSRIEAYVEARASIEGQRALLTDRLVGYINMYHPSLAQGADVPTFATGAIAFAREHDVLEEEGITWLTLILLAAWQKTDRDLSWISTILRFPGATEEQRVLLVHQKAIERGLIQS